MVNIDLYNLYFIDIHMVLGGLVAKSCLTLETPRKASLSVGFPRQEYWSGLPFPSPGALANPVMEPTSTVLQVDSY